MLNRCILIFTEFENTEKIKELREKYDPVVDKVAPHITLVFPFESDIKADKIREHIEKNIKGIDHFEIKLQGITGESDNYLFLNVIKGKDELSELHNRLYTDILEEFKPDFLKSVKFKPHLTVGKIDSDEGFARALKDTENFTEVFKTVVKKITVEIIGENNESIIESEIELN
ncbi:2'-5' RNA ligase family protein [Wukongibacter baidiensis]|uniref:2'-5' RNA ligase family protein n=1 Tax=Wukongibacter baidiensis TaxID=1723361 RepID=UPI003D7F4373